MVHVVVRQFSLKSLLRFNFEKLNARPIRESFVVGLFRNSKSDMSTYSTRSNGSNGVAFDGPKTPLVLFCGGSFNPVTNMHLRMFGKSLSLFFGAA